MQVTDDDRLDVLWLYAALTETFFYTLWGDDGAVGDHLLDSGRMASQVSANAKIEDEVFSRCRVTKGESERRAHGGLPGRRARDESGVDQL